MVFTGVSKAIIWLLMITVFLMIFWPVLRESNALVPVQYFLWQYYIAVLCIYFIVVAIWQTYKYSRYEHILISRSWVVMNGRVYSDKNAAIKQVSSDTEKVYQSNIYFLNKNIKWWDIFDKWRLLVFIVMALWGIWYIIIGILYIVVYLVYFISILLLPILRLFGAFNRFTTYWEKIQSLTPLVEEKSREIQKNFQEDMNFSVLSDGFDSLASTFSEIITLVIKLEKIEAKANKGNLFDSEKYINSLRADILVPLKSLKSFLETQKEELGKSQWELKKVRVRVEWVDPSLWSGWQEQKELASKRSESLLMELTENIEKLDTMIQKIA